MRLLELELTNFKGIRHRTLNPDGRSMNIFGANFTYKTTIADAYFFLLFNKDTRDRTPADFGIKTRITDPDDENYMEPIHHLEHAVRGVFDLEGTGDSLELKKVYKENWGSTAGTTEQFLKGHTKQHFIDGEPVTQTEYQDHVNTIIDESKFKMITLPNYFAETMHWTERQDILFEIAGEITNEDIIKVNPKFSDIPDILDGKDEDSRKEILRTRLNDMKKHRDKIPTRIDEKERGLPESIPDKEEQEALLKKLESDKEKLIQKKSETTNEKAAEITTKLTKIAGKKTERKNELEEEKYEKEIKSIRSDLSDANDTVAEIRSTLAGKKSERDSLNRQINNIDITGVEQKIRKVRQQDPPEFKRPGDCPTCGTPPDCPHCGETLRGDGIEAERKKHEQAVQKFNNDKAEEIKGLQKEIEKRKARKHDLSTTLLGVNNRINELQEQLRNAESKVADLEQDLSDAKDQKIDPLNDDTYLEYIQKEQELRKEKKRLETNIEAGKKEIQKEIDEINEQIKTANSEISKVDSYHEDKNRIAELNQEIKEYHSKMEAIERKLLLIDQFKQAKAEYITDRVNDEFEIVNWKMYEMQMNNSMNHRMCQPIIKGIPYEESPSTSERIQAGIDIIRTLSRHFGIDAPIWVDNRESVTELPVKGNELQIFSLIVSPQDDELRIEIDRTGEDHVTKVR